jgi:membrane-associated protein
MTISEQLLGALVLYGLPILFGVLVMAAIGLPLPATLLLIAAGSFVDRGVLNLWAVLGVALVAAVLGDQIGYGLGRWGGRSLAVRIGDRMGTGQLDRAEALAARWGSLGIFLSRWLLSPLGPAINLSSGLAAYPWLAFLALDIAGEIIWVGLYVWLGRLFSDRVEALSDLLGNLTWALVGLLFVLLLGWKLLQSWRVSHPATTHAPLPATHGSSNERRTGS